MRLEVEFKPTVQQVAELFASWDDERQADFFEAVARVFASWNVEKPGASDTQIYGIGRHMKTCVCVTETGRELVRYLAHVIGPEDYGAVSHKDSKLTSPASKEGE